MFDDIGTTDDPGRARRQAESGAFTLGLAGLVGGLVGLIVSSSPPLATSSDPPVIVLEPMEIDDGIAKAVAPDLPAAGGPAARRAPDEPVEPVVPPTIVREPIVESRPIPDGTGDGDGEGALGGSGDGDGVPGGQGTCRGADCGGGGGARALQVRFRRAVEPVYPRAALAMDLGVQRCRARVMVRPDGRADSVEVSGCPTVFHEGTREAMFRSRWTTFDAEPGTLASFEVLVVFRQN